jgi:hypothetical protein
MKRLAVLYCIVLILAIPPSGPAQRIVPSLPLCVSLSRGTTPSPSTSTPGCTAKRGFTSLSNCLPHYRNRDEMANAWLVSNLRCGKVSGPCHAVRAVLPFRASGCGNFSEAFPFQAGAQIEVTLPFLPLLRRQI